MSHCSARKAKRTTNRTSKRWWRSPPCREPPSKCRPSVRRTRLRGARKRSVFAERLPVLPRRRWHGHIGNRVDRSARTTGSASELDPRSVQGRTRTRGNLPEDPRGDAGQSHAECDPHPDGAAMYRPGPLLRLALTPAQAGTYQPPTISRSHATSAAGRDPGDNDRRGRCCRGWPLTKGRGKIRNAAGQAARHSPGDRRSELAKELAAFAPSQVSVRQHVRLQHDPPGLGRQHEWSCLVDVGLAIHGAGPLCTTGLRARRAALRDTGKMTSVGRQPRFQQRERAFPPTTARRIPCILSTPRDS
jgi:hypothetical protein